MAIEISIPESVVGDWIPTTTNPEALYHLKPVRISNTQLHKNTSPGEKRGSKITKWPALKTHNKCSQGSLWFYSYFLKHIRCDYVVFPVLVLNLHSDLCLPWPNYFHLVFVNMTCLCIRACGCGQIVFFKQKDPNVLMLWCYDESCLNSLYAEE